MKRILLSIFIATTLAAEVIAHEAHKHEAGKETKAAGETITVKDEVLDMACYIDHGATGAKHADCAKTCIESGLSVGIKGEDGKTYLLIGGKGASLGSVEGTL